jgi:hypothetical protein
MKKNPIFCFYKLKWYDLLIYLALVSVQLYLNLCVDWKLGIVSSDARGLILGVSSGLQFFVLYLLHFWIKNAFNWIFLLLLGVWQTVFWLKISVFTFETLDKWNLFGLNGLFPLLILMQLFRIWKLNVKGEELAIPIRRESLFGKDATLIDLICCLVSMGFIFFLPAAHYWLFEY